MNSESWCIVERSSKEHWTRSERRHSDSILKSTVFEDKDKNLFCENCASSSTNCSNAIKRKKHFPQKCKLYILYSYNNYIIYIYCNNIHFRVLRNVKIYYTIIIAQMNQC